MQKTCSQEEEFLRKYVEGFQRSISIDIIFIDLKMGLRLNSQIDDFT